MQLLQCSLWTIKREERERGKRREKERKKGRKRRKKRRKHAFPHEIY
jgi:hypothetical protein